MEGSSKKSQGMFFLALLTLVHTHFCEGSLSEESLNRQQSGGDLALRHSNLYHKVYQPFVLYH